MKNICCYYSKLTYTPMRKLLVLFLAFLFGSTQIVFAEILQPENLVEWIQLDVSDSNLQVTLPSDYAVLMRNMNASDPLLKQLGVTPKEVNDLLTSSSTYIEAFSPDGQITLSITIGESIWRDYSELHDLDILSLYKNVKEDNPEPETIAIFDPYTNRQGNKFAVFTMADMNDLECDFIVYETTVSEKLITCYLQSYSDTLSENEHALIEYFVNNLVFTNQKIPTASDSFSYADLQSGATFILPPNWGKADFSQTGIDERSILPNAVVFSPHGINYQSLLYYSADVWEAMDQTVRKTLETAGYRRANISSSLYSVEEIAMNFNCDVKDIQRIVLGSHEFFLFSKVEPHETNGVTNEVLNHYAICYEDGYAYTFIQGNWLRSKDTYNSFIDIIKSFSTSTISTADPSRIEFTSESHSLSLLLPKGWIIQSNADMSGSCLFAKNMKSMDPSIMLATNDLWAMLSEDTRSWYQSIGIDRTIMDKRIMNAETVASMFNQSTDNLQLWEGDHLKYYLYWDVTDATIQGKPAKVDCLCAYTVQNGYSYYFMLFDPSNAEENMEAYFELLKTAEALEPPK